MAITMTDDARAERALTAELGRVRRNQAARLQLEEAVGVLLQSGRLQQLAEGLGYAVTPALPCPSDCLAEQSCLGAAMMEPEAADLVATRLRPWMFYVPSHRAIALAILRLRQRAIQRGAVVIDIVTVHGQLAADGTVSDVGGIDALTALIDACPSSANVNAYIEPVLECAKRRQLLRLSECLQAGVLGQADSGRLVNAVRNAALDVLEGRGIEDVERFFEEAK